jgi:hypothetical protein
MAGRHYVRAQLEHAMEARDRLVVARAVLVGAAQHAAGVGIGGVDLDELAPERDGQLDAIERDGDAGRAAQDLAVARLERHGLADVARRGGDVVLEDQRGEPAIGQRRREARVERQRPLDRLARQHLPLFRRPQATAALVHVDRGQALPRGRVSGRGDQHLTVQLDRAGEGFRRALPFERPPLQEQRVRGRVGSGRLSAPRRAG